MSSTTSAAARQQATDEHAPDRAAARLARLPTPFWLFTLTLAGVLVGITVTKGVQDPDFFWHLTAGQWMADHGQVPSTDPFSFTWAGQPWTPARVAVRAAHVLAGQRGRPDRRAVRVRALPGGHRHQPGPDAVAPGRQPARVCAAGGADRPGHHALRDAAAAGRLVAVPVAADLVPAGAQAGTAVAGAAADPVLRAVGEPARRLRHRPGRGRHLLPVHHHRPNAHEPGEAAAGRRRHRLSCWPPWSPRPARSGSSTRSATWSSPTGAWPISRSGSRRRSTSRRTGPSPG